MNEDIIESEQIQNLFNVLTREENSVFYGANEITKTLVKKIKKSAYDRYKTFLSIYNRLEDKKGDEENKVKK